MIRRAVIVVCFAATAAACRSEPERAETAGGPAPGNRVSGDAGPGDAGRADPVDASSTPDAGETLASDAGIDPFGAACIVGTVVDAGAPVMVDAGSHHGGGHPPPHGDDAVDAGPPPARVNVVVDTNQRFQTVTGFGATAVPFENDRFYNSHVGTVPRVVTATPAQRQALAKRIFEDLGMTRARLPYRGIEPANDNGDANAFDWSKFVFDYRPTADADGSLATGPDHTAALVKEAIPFGLSTYFPVSSVEWESAWLRVAGGPQVAPGMEAEFAELMAAAVKRYADLGVEPPYISVANEPSYATGRGASLTPAQLVDVVKFAGRRFRALGLSTKLVAPDDFSPSNALPYVRALVADAEARGYLGAIAYHSYDAYVSTRDILATSGMGAPPAGPIAERETIRDLAAQVGLPVWMTESSGWDDGLGRYKTALARVNHLHDELVYADVAAFDQMSHWFLDRTGNEEALATVAFDASGNLSNFAALPVGIAMSHWALNVRPGSVRVAATSTNARVRTSAFIAPGNRLVVVIINNWSNGVSLSLGTPSAAVGGLGERVVTTETQRRVSSRFSVAPGANDFCLPPESITTIAFPL